MVYLLVWVTTPIRNTVLAVNSDLEFVVLLFFAILAGVSFAADEAVQAIFTGMTHFPYLSFRPSIS